jgi:formylglycine-generating enzyme required for sulfatase activity
MQVNGRNYLIPVGARIEHEKQVEFESVDMGALLAEMENARNRMNIVILDACRDNPFARSFRSSVQGLASVNAPSGTLIAYATAPGSVANDGPAAHGVYTGELVKVIQKPGLRIEDVFKQVRSAVREATQGKQIPWESSSLEGDFFFRAQSPEASPPAVAEKPPAAQVAPVARSEHQPKPVKTWREPVTGIQFVWVPGGCYLMGSPQTEGSRHMDEGPVHEVCVKDLWFGKFEITNEEFKKFQSDHNSGTYEKHSLNGDRQPAVHVSWEDAKSFAQWLTEQNGGQYRFRLPTEAEWEFAARGGASGSRYWGDDPKRACEYENVADSSAQKLWGWQDIHQCDDGYAATAPVGSFQPNGFGLYDMLGNVSEWCEDIYGVDVYASYDRDNPLHRGWGAGLDRVVRGGQWHGGPERARSAVRSSGMPRAMNDDLGVRLVREP